MGVNKVVFGAASIMDISDSTVTADKLAEGITAYAANGEKITGTMPSELDTSDATATASDIVKGATAYVNGEKITGNVKEMKSDSTLAYSSSFADSSGVIVGRVVSQSTGEEQLMTRYKANKDALIRTGCTLAAYVNFDKFGDATAADVAAGKTFTSSAGLKVTGTGSSGGSVSSDDNCEAYAITSASTALSFKRTDGTIKVWGYGYKTVSTYQKTVYAFCGDGYYTGTSYGTPTKTSVTWSLNSDGTLSGLPSGLTALDVLVTKGA